MWNGKSKAKPPLKRRFGTFTATIKSAKLIKKLTEQTMKFWHTSDTF